LVMREVFRPVAIMSGMNQKRRDHRVSGEDSGEKASRDAASLSRWWVLAAAGLIIAAGALAYANSFHGPFILDDIDAIPKNPYVRRLWPIWEAMSAPAHETTAAGRPVVSLSLALNYAISGLGVWSYHVLNLVVHILAAMVLFGIVRRTLLSEKLRDRFGKASAVLALICALIWVVHPLQTQAVTYVIQRAESLMGLFYLLVLYCAIRSFTSAHKRRWCAAAIVSCALGMGTKEVMASAPLMVLLYDRLFIARSFKEILKRRWVLYAGLAATWVILGALVAAGPRSRTAGLGLTITPLDYAATQCNVIVYYLRLSFWPDPLVLDYAWPIAKDFGDFAPAGAVLAALLAGTLVAFRYRPGLGFLGAWFFVILGPSSSFLPIITEVAAEHRMYLSLAAVVVLVVICGYALGRRLPGLSAASDARRRMIGRVLGYSLAGAVVVTLGLLTARRNVDYRSRISIWQDLVDKRPSNHHAHNNLAFWLTEDGQIARAMGHLSEALRINPRFALAYNNRGTIYGRKGDYDRAIRDYDKAIESDPKHAGAYKNRGTAYEKKGDYDRAIRDYDKAIELKPDFAMAYNSRGIVYEKKGDHDRAVRDFDKVIELKPDFAQAYNSRGIVYKKKGDYDRAIRDFDKVIELKPDFAEAYNSRGAAYENKGDYVRAVRDFDKAIELKPGLTLAYNNMAIALVRRGKAEYAIRHYRKALHFNGEWVVGLNNLAWILATNENAGLRNGPEAVRLAERACKLTDNKVSGALDTLAAAYAETGRFAEAVKTAEEAVRLAASTGEEQSTREIRSRLELYKLKRPYRHRRRPDAPANP